jgi:DNA-binding phage protein
MATAKKAPAKAHTPRGHKQDRARVATKQPYELAYEAKKTGASKPAVKAAAKKAGPSRKEIEKALKNKKSPPWMALSAA